MKSTCSSNFTLLSRHSKTPSIRTKEDPLHLAGYSPTGVASREYRRMQLKQAPLSTALHVCHRYHCLHFLYPSNVWFSFSSSSILLLAFPTFFRSPLRASFNPPSLPPSFAPSHPGEGRSQQVAEPPCLLDTARNRPFYPPWPCWGQACEYMCICEKNHAASAVRKYL